MFNFCGGPNSRTFRVRWMPEELGVPDEDTSFDHKSGAHTRPESLPKVAEPVNRISARPAFQRAME